MPEVVGQHMPGDVCKPSYLLSSRLSMAGGAVCHHPEVLTVYCCVARGFQEYGYTALQQNSDVL